MIDAGHYRSQIALQEFQNHANLVRKAAIRVGSDSYSLFRPGPFLTTLSRSCCEYNLAVLSRQAFAASFVVSQLSAQLQILTIQFVTAHDSRPPFGPVTPRRDPKAVCDLSVRLHEQKSGDEDLGDPIPRALAECHLLRYLSIELPSARLHSTFSMSNGDAVPSELTRIGLSCNATSLVDLIPFLAITAAANLVSVKIQASLMGVHTDLQPALLARLGRLELVTVPRGWRRDSTTDWPAIAFPHLIDPSSPIQILILRSLSPNDIYSALTFFERAQPIETLQHVRIVAANEDWSVRCSSGYKTLADELQVWTAQTGIKTEVIW